MTTQNNFGWVGQRPWVWALAFAAAMGAIAWGEHMGMLGGWRTLPLIALGMLLLWPMMKSASNRQTACGTMSSAMARYNRRTMIWAFSYVIALGTAMTIKNTQDPQGTVLFLIALLPSLPILFFVWTLARYLVEEEDEYIRHRSIMASLAGLGLVLTLGTFWGFLETFGVARHVEGWWVVPVWAIGMGLGQFWMTLRDRKGEEE